MEGASIHRKGKREGVANSVLFLTNLVAWHRISSTRDLQTQWRLSFAG